MRSVFARASVWSCRVMGLFAVGMLTLSPSHAAGVDNPRMLKDINTLPEAQDSVCGPAVDLNGVAYFCGANEQLWSTDGTPAGTQPVKLNDHTIVEDVNSGLYRSGRFLYFTRYSHFGGGSREFWRTDGTPRGTMRVKDKDGNDLYANYGTRGESLFDVNGELFAFMSDALWKTNGTSAGTVLLRSSPGFTDFPDSAIAAGSTFFYINDENQLWKSDGTSAGTVMVKDMPGRFGDTCKHNLTDINGTLFFGLEDDGNKCDLWKSDGTRAGTVFVADNIATLSLDEGSFQNVNGTLYFDAWDDGSSWGSRRNVVWTSDGTTSGTKMMSAIPEGGIESAISFRNRYVFAKYSDANQCELWASDGTEPGTTRLAQHLESCYLSKAIYSNMLYVFTTNSTRTEQALWKTDGTVAGTVLVREFTTHDSPSAMNYFGAIGATSKGLFFQADMATRYGGSALWVTKGTAATTKLVKDVSQYTDSSYPSSSVVVGNEVFFLANQTRSPGYRNQWELWKTNGSTEGTQLVLNLIKEQTYGRGNFGKEYAGLANLDDMLYVSGRDDSGWGMWRTDGTPAGTQKLNNVLPGGAKAIMTQLTVHDHKLYFFAPTTQGMALWRLGPNQTTAALVKNGLSSPSSLKVMAGMLVFANRGHELWRSDGTSSGTRMITSLAQAADLQLDELQSFQNRILFRARWNCSDSDEDGCYYDNTSLWISDGTQSGTYPLTDTINNNYPQSIIVVGQNVMFSSYGYGLWMSDGTQAGTQNISDLVGIDNLTKVGDVAFFSIDGELWTSNGTAVGTRAVKTGIRIMSPMIDINGEVYFSAYDVDSDGEERKNTFSLRKSNGTEAGTVVVRPGLHLIQSLEVPYKHLLVGTLSRYRTIGQVWETDGTSLGTRQLSNIPEGGIGYYSSSMQPRLFNDMLFIPMSGNQKGIEPWVFDLK